MKPPAAIVAVVASLTALVGVACGVVQSSSDRSSTPDVSQTESIPSPTSTTTSTPSTPSPVSQNRSTSSSPAVSQSKNSTAAPTDSTPDSATRTVESCVVKMVVVNDPESPLNVRSSPTTATNNVVGQLKNGAIVTVTNEANGWFEITEPLKGWISKQRTKHGCNQKVERVRFDSNGASVTIADQFIGTGSHRYILTASKGQTMTVTGKTGPFPFVIGPGGKPLVGGTPGDENRTRWTEQLPQSGEYAIELDSNFRGYEYAFTVTIG